MLVLLIVLLIVLLLLLVLLLIPFVVPIDNIVGGSRLFAFHRHHDRVCVRALEPLLGRYGR